MYYPSCTPDDKIAETCNISMLDGLVYLLYLDRVVGAVSQSTLYGCETFVGHEVVTHNSDHCVTGSMHTPVDSQALSVQGLIHIVVLTGIKALPVLCK